MLLPRREERLWQFPREQKGMLTKIGSESEKFGGGLKVGACAREDRQRAVELSSDTTSARSP